MPRVLQVLEATIGGTKRHLLDLSAGLQQAGWDVTVACPRVRSHAHGDVSFWDDLRAAGIPTIELAMRRATLSPANLRATWELASMIRRGGFDLVHAHSSVAGAVARPAALLASIAQSKIQNPQSKIVYTPHGYAFLAPGSARRAMLYLQIERALGRITDRLIALSSTEAQATLEHHVVPPDRMATIPLGVRPEDFPTPEEVSEIRRRQGWEGVPVVGTLSRMTAQKDPLTWVRAAGLIAGVRPDVRFAWIWGGELEPQVRSAARDAGLEGKIDFLGHRPDARALIAAFEVFLLTSAFEGLPYSVIESLMARTPVVATAVVGTRDLVRHEETGLLAPAGDAEKLASGVLRVLNDPNLARRLAEAGRAFALERFSVQSMVEQTARLYSQLLATPAR